MKQRSAGFPTMSLADALERTRRIYDVEPHNEMDSEAAARHMGYSGKTGTSMSVVATLRRYGLLEGRGDKIRVSRDAVTVFADERAPDQSERAEALRRFAKAPDIFAELQGAFKGVPAVDTLVPALVKRGFTRQDAVQAAANYVQTLEYVRKETEGYNSVPAQDEPVSEARMEQLAIGGPAAPSTRNVSLPLSASQWATLSAPFPLTEETWTQMMDILRAMKPALVLSANRSDNQS